MQKCALSRKNISLDIHYIVYLKCIGAIYRIKFPDGGAEFRMFHLYHCKDCDFWFIDDDGFKRMRFKKEIIAKAIHQHIDGFSLFKVQYHLWQHEGIKVSRKTILLWERKYSAFLKSDK